MTASLETLVVAAYVFAESLWIPRPGPVGKISDGELIALAVAQAATGPALGPSVPRAGRSALARLVSAPARPDPVQPSPAAARRPTISTVQLMVAELIAEGQVRLADGTLIACANYPGCASHSHFAGHAALRLLPLQEPIRLGHAARPARATSKGCRSAMTSSVPRPARSARAPTSSPRPTPAAPCSQTAASGAPSTSARWSSSGVQLVTPDKHKLGERPPAELAKARIRLVIESVFSNLKRQMRLEDHLAKTLGGLAQRIAQRLLALTLGIFINLLAGRPARALVAYDGR